VWDSPGNAQMSRVCENLLIFIIILFYGWVEGVWDGEENIELGELKR
jgi:hypothetical protein